MFIEIKTHFSPRKGDENHQIVRHIFNVDNGIASFTISHRSKQSECVMRDVLLSNDAASEAQVDAKFARRALRRMFFIRAFEKKCMDLSAAQPPIAAGSIHLCAGQEAIPVGACDLLSERDRVVATYRGHGWALEAGLDPFAVLSEICHRSTGINGGRAGSAYLTGAGTKFIGENSIVGAGAAIANGVAMALQATGGVVLVSVGDGAMNQGALHESIVFAAARSLPVVFVCENNGWSELTPTSRIVLVDRLSKRAHGYGIPGATIDGCDPIAVRQTIGLAMSRARNGAGPSLIECKTVRLWGHYNRDVEHYRPKSDRIAAEEQDPIAKLRRRLVQVQLAQEAELQREEEEVYEEVDRLAERVIAAPLPDPETARACVISEPASAVAQNGGANSVALLTYQQAINEALRDELETRPELVIFGEDVGHAGGIFGCTRGLQKAFGVGRVFDTPISEAAILGAAVGSAIGGMRPVAEIMWMDFLMVALDQLVNQAANVRYISRGKTTAPLVIRVQQGVTPGSCAQHSQSLEAILAHIPGLKVGLPATPQDAYDMLRAAAADPDPCIIIEARSLYQIQGEVTKSITPVGSARLRKSGSDIALVSWGKTVDVILEAAKKLADEGIDAAVLDLRWLSPLDFETLKLIVERTKGRALIVHEANRTGGFGAEVSTLLFESGYSRIGRLATPDVRIPASPVLQMALLPSASSVAAAAKKIVEKH